jgi:hypothetical protein
MAKNVFDIKLSITIIALYVLTAFTGIEIGYKGDEYCGIYDCLQEIDMLPKFDSTKHSIAAKYCLDSTQSLSSFQKFIFPSGSCSLLLYEQIIPLAVKIQIECHSHSIDGEIYLEPIRMFFGGLFGGGSFCMDASIPPKENYVCKTDINEYYDIYKYISAFGVDNYGNTSYLLDKYFPIKWNLEIDCDGEEIPIPAPKNYYIYVSGFCNKEHLEKIEEIKKNEKNKK